jgi:simple sugar transport system permease protein
MSDRKRGVLAKVGLFFTDRDKLEPAMVTLLAAVFAVAAGVGLIFLVSKQPVESTRNFLLGPLLRTYNFYYLLVVMVPLTFTGLALCVIYSLKYMSLIADASFYFGAVIATAIGIHAALPTGLHPLAAMAAAGVAGGLIGTLPAILRIKWRANELVSSLMLNYIFFFLGSFIILYFLRDRSQTILAT